MAKILLLSGVDCCCLSKGFRYIIRLLIWGLSFYLGTRYWIFFLKTTLSPTKYFYFDLILWIKSFSSWLVCWSSFHSVVCHLTAVSLCALWFLLLLTLSFNPWMLFQFFHIFWDFLFLLKCSLFWRKFYGLLRRPYIL